MLHVSRATLIIDLYISSDFNPTRDSAASPTLSSGGYTDTNSMTVETCVNFCNARNFFYAGLENGQDCRKWCLQVIPLFFLISTILIALLGNKIVGMLYPTGQSHRRQSVPLRARAI